MTQLDGFNIFGGSPGKRLFGIDVDTLLVDSSIITVKSGSNAVVNSIHAGPENIFKQNDADPYNAAMPLPGKVICVIWNLASNPTTVQTFTFNILKNGGVAQASVLFVAVGQSGFLVSDPLDIPFVAGDRIEIQRVRSGNSSNSPVGAFGLCIKWD